MTVYTDSATIVVHVGPVGTPYEDTATIRVAVSVSGVDKLYSPDFTGEGVPYNQYGTWEGFSRYECDEANSRFNASLRFGAVNA